MQAHQHFLEMYVETSLHWPLCCCTSSRLFPKNYLMLCAFGFTQNVSQNKNHLDS